LAIAILIEIYKKKRSQKDELVVLDFNIILDYLFKIKFLLLYIVMMFVPLLFWESSSGKFRIIELFISVIGIIFIIKILLNTYQWIKGNVWNSRAKYLIKLKKPEDMIKVWRSVWQSSSLDTGIEKDFFNIYSSKLDKLFLQKKKLKYLQDLLSLFSYNINNRSDSFLEIVCVNYFL